MLSNSDSSARPIQQARTKGTRRRGDLRHVGGHDVRPLLSGRIRWRGGGSGMRKGTISGVGWNASAEMLVAEWRLYLYDPIGDLRDATDTNSENALHMTTLLTRWRMMIHTCQTFGNVQSSTKRNWLTRVAPQETSRRSGTSGPDWRPSLTTKMRTPEAQDSCYGRTLATQAIILPVPASRS